MTNSDDDAPLGWTVRVEDVPARGLVWSAIATPDERHRVAKALDIKSLAALSAEGRIEAIAGGCYRVKATLKAELVQACVITLEPVPGRIDEPLRVEFRPGDMVEDELSTTPDIDAEFDVEAIVNGHLETGRVVYEQLASSLNPYPRAPGAGLPDVLTAGAEIKPINPFAVLAKLKDKS
jgi:uncharacterized metal-binding protein YceD (DUF177 family)